MEILKKAAAFVAWCSTPEGTQIIELVLPFLTAIASIIGLKVLHLTPKTQQEVGKAIQYVAKGLEDGTFNKQTALAHILSTGKVPESKAATIITALVNNEDATVAPTKGVAVTITPDGKVSVDPSGFIAKKTYKISKWLKKRAKNL